MKALNGFVYGHYDSRGGSSFILASTREEADRIYAYHFYGKDLIDELSQEDWWKGLQAYTEGDYLFHALLHVPDGFDVQAMNGQDLEHSNQADYKRLRAELVEKYGDLTREYFEHSKELYDLPPMGQVLAPGFCTRLEDIPTESRDFFDMEGGPETPVHLEFVPTGAQPSALLQFSHPRWDDDAYSFVFVSRLAE
jgi:hypothetical protein